MAANPTAAGPTATVAQSADPTRALTIGVLPPALEPTLESAYARRQGQLGPFHRAEIDIAFPIDNVGTHLPSLLATVAGNLFRDGETFAVGDLPVEVMHVPGHTPACVAYRVGDAVFVGDTLFMPDVGTARCDFPGGNAHALYASIRRLLALPPETRLFVCHDYPPAGREVRFESTVAEQRAHNIHVHDGMAEDQFVAMRQRRDATLDMPVLILPSVQVNIRAGQLPPPEANGTSYLKIPVNAL